MKGGNDMNNNELKKFNTKVHNMFADTTNEDIIRAAGIMLADNEIEKDNYRTRLIANTVAQLSTASNEQLEYLLAFTTLKIANS